ncbi:hypothetical protein BU24DRAFT_33717 [Aaosphaeria arxii CBS 175.79]|uniref:DUF8040 domain-containing protein n=1 Tax=Aaosphaeria arxii CBS 175.79 TaxID=1450172 RepID=A0A6A5YB96_9PLEO|nr:uncharacterized protein BU24DRAFT_33717 [Aaosphaeria arxii CBS 175.79]KAF2021971.1 hypothetical protein BU24DRAFT_33717 [Aaosphaeria arxii CBS 175.79]
MAVTGTAGADRARYLLNTIPDRFNEFTHMDQMTFFQLADWIVENVESSTAKEDISVEESLFVFLDIVAQGNSFRDAAYNWDHDIDLTQRIFLNVINALRVLREKEDVSPSCPSFNTSKTRWRVLKSWRPGKLRMDGLVKVGDDRGDGLDIAQQDFIEAITALNNFIHERKEF